MKPKTLAFVVLLLAVLSGIVYLVRRPPAATSSDARLNQRLANPATLDKAAKIKITDQGKTVDLVKSSDGTWHVASYFDLPADLSKLSRFVGDLTDAKLQRLVTTNPERIARLEFKDTRITFLDGADKELWSATLGKTSESGGRFVKFGDESKAYLASLNAWLDVDAKNWANTQLVDLKSDDVAKVELSFPEAGAAPVIASRAKKEDPFVAENAPAGKKLKPETVSTLLGSFSGLRFSDTSELNDPNAVAAKDHARTVKLTTFAGKTTTITLGRKPEEKIVKAPASTTAKSGPSSILPTPAPESKGPGEDDAAKGGPAKTLEPSTETIPAGPVFVSVTYPEAKAPAASLMEKRAVSISEYLFTSLPQKPDEMFESADPASTPAQASPAPATPPSPSSAAANPQP